ncbi:hypothetical protein IJG78_01570, partial [Candidatus Saccharibacteria bacterium]|nr:hypothetical protein [Candidatus Saccharibacteria bacterium]
TVTANIESSGYKITVKSSDVAMNLTTTPTGATTFAKDTIITNTNSPSGFKLYTSMAGESSALYQDGDSASSNFISPTAGTFSAPDVLATNSWGISTAAITTGSESTFWSMPSISNPQLIQTTNSANTSMSEADGTKKDIYYGIKANFATKSGSYSGTIAYTAAANASPSGDSTFTISPNISENGSLSGGDIVTILTTLYTNYALSGSDVSVTIGGNSCPVSSVYTDTDQGTVAIKCTTPASSTYGLKDVVVNIPKFDWNATLTNGFNYGDFWSITYMQDMNSAICNTAYTPSNVTGSSALLKTSRADYTAITSGTAQVPERTLTDKRDSSTYTVRKLADGNCWMTQNLRLNLSTSKALTPQDTDVTSSVTPNNNTQTSGGTAWDTTSWRSYHSTNNNYGNYYNWYAATAGKASSLSDEQITPTSICPKGWKLPAGGSDIATNEMAHLFQVYGATPASSSSQSESTVNSYNNIIKGSPLNWYMGGYYLYSNGSWMVDGAGSFGFYWQGTKKGTSGAYVLYFINRFDFQPTSSHGIDKGDSIRCLAR